MSLANTSGFASGAAPLRQDRQRSKKIPSIWTPDLVCYSFIFSHRQLYCHEYEPAAANTPSARTGNASDRVPTSCKVSEARTKTIVGRECNANQCESVMVFRSVSIGVNLRLEISSPNPACILCPEIFTTMVPLFLALSLIVPPKRSSSRPTTPGSAWDTCTSTSATWKLRKSSG